MTKHGITWRRARRSRRPLYLRCSIKTPKATGGRCSMPLSTRRRDRSRESRQAQRQGQGQSQRQSRLQGWQREQRDDLTLSEAGHILWERRALVAGCTLFFLALALLYSLSQEPVYTAQATLSVRSQEGIAPAGSFDEVLSGLRDSAEMQSIRERAAEKAGWEAGQGDFNER